MKSMDPYKAWEKALKKTEIIRSRVKELMTFASTSVPYILLSESEVDQSDTVVRRGEVLVRRPALILPPNLPQFEGFEFERQGEAWENNVSNFLLVRGIQMPSMRYDNRTQSLDIFEGNLSKAVMHYNGTLERQENVQAGLLTGPQDCWQFSLLIYISSQIMRNAETDIRKLLDEYKKKRK